ncbi:hypothetical protein [Aeromicrobium sp.]|uniref:hypothetical protein n=1 Tax=Aeromicrobium sp. TaxID=1871063 RepID=UPI0028A62939|nr:hypothetical protein [Aeromicrobium sp.]
MNFRKPAAALAAVALSFGLTACGGGGQSVDEACKVAETEVKDAMGDMSSIDPSDTDKATDTIASMSKALDDTEKKIENDKVKKAVGDLSTEFGKLETAFSDLKDAGQDTEKLTAVSEQMSKISTDVQAKGEKLDELCG